MGPFIVQLRIKGLSRNKETGCIDSTLSQNFKAESCFEHLQSSRSASYVPRLGFAMFIYKIHSHLRYWFWSGLYNGSQFLEVCVCFLTPFTNTESHTPQKESHEIRITWAESEHYKISTYRRKHHVFYSRLREVGGQGLSHLGWENPHSPNQRGNSRCRSPASLF